MAPYPSVAVLQAGWESPHWLSVVLFMQHSKHFCSSAAKPTLGIYKHSEALNRKKSLLSGEALLTRLHLLQY